MDGLVKRLTHGHGGNPWRLTDKEAHTLGAKYTQPQRCQRKGNSRPDEAHSRHTEQVT